jgi:hypothetical protein
VGAEVVVPIYIEQDGQETHPFIDMFYAYHKGDAFIISLNNTHHIKHLSCWGPVANACNPSYSAGRDQEDLWFEASPWQIVQKILYLKKP